MNAEFQEDFRPISDSKELIVSSNTKKYDVEFELQENDNDEVYDSNMANKSKCTCLP